MHNACPLARLGQQEMSTIAGSTSHSAGQLDTPTPTEQLQVPSNTPKAPPPLSLLPVFSPYSPWQQSHTNGFSVAGTYLLVGTCCSSAWMRAEHILSHITPSPTDYGKSQLNSLSAVSTTHFSGDDTPHTQKSVVVSQHSMKLLPCSLLLLLSFPFPLPIHHQPHHHHHP